MAVPIIIPARNEAMHIGETLQTLSRQEYDVEPIVVINGSSDATSEIAQSYGATVLSSAEGKMPALQHGLRYLGQRALEPLLILDADSKPLSSSWSNRMTQAVGAETDRPGIVWGQYVFHGEINPIAATVYNAASMRVSWADRNKDMPRTVRGGNTGLQIHNKAVLDDLLALDNYWPREDVAIFDTLMNHNATKTVVFDPRTWVQTSGYRHAGILKKVLSKHRHPSIITDESYANEAPRGSMPYNSTRRI